MTRNMTRNTHPDPALHGTGLGLRRDFLSELRADPPVEIDFYEVAPENWMRTGGRLGRQFRELTERHHFATHGLSLSIGGPAPLDLDFVRETKQFLDLHGITMYSEHLTYCSDDGHLYDLLPIPFTPEAIDHVVARIQQVQDILGRRLVLENASYYAAFGAEMTEAEFINEVLERADCLLLLDVNNVYVNAVNHGYDARDFLARLPAPRVAYVHVAGHYNEAEDLIIDTHGSNVIDPVWDLLDAAYARFGVLPTLLERDFNIPPLPELVREAGRIREIADRHRLVGTEASA